MCEYDEQYFFVRSADNDSLPDLAPDENTANLDYDFEIPKLGSAPFIFYNGAKEYNTRSNVQRIKIVPEILFDGTNILIPGRIREDLLELDIPNLYMHPAVYIHDDGKWYENYWYMTFTDRFDCWDRHTSDFEQDEPPIRLGGFELYQIYSYSLDSDLLEKIPLEKRLLFKMGGSLDAFIVCHQSIAQLFRLGTDGGTHVALVSDY